MTIENHLNIIGVDLKRIADALENVSKKIIGITLGKGYGAGETTKPKKNEVVKKTRGKGKKKEETVVADIGVDYIKVDDLDKNTSPVKGYPVELEGENEKIITAEDVKLEARKFVDGAGTDKKRERFEEAKKIIKILGATSLDKIDCEKYREAINLFRKASEGWTK